LRLPTAIPKPRRFSFRSPTSIRGASSAYYRYTIDATKGGWEIDGGKYYENSGSLNFGTSSTTTPTSCIYVGTTANVATTHLKIASGTTTSWRMDIGYVTGANAAVSISGSGTVANLGAVVVGYSGTGALTVSGGAQVSTGDSAAVVGNSVGSQGALTVTGSGTRFDVGNALFLGQSGAGTVTISDNAAIVAAGCLINFMSSPTASGKVYLSNGGALITKMDTTTDYLDGYIAAGDLYVDGGSGYAQVTDKTSALITYGYYSYAGHESLYSLYNLDTSASYTFLVANSTVPEPATFAFIGGLGALGVGLLRRRGRK
jgi:T5SS/PEP-CTERM-associated repeat protein